MIKDNIVCKFKRKRRKKCVHDKEIKEKNPKIE